MLFEVVSQGEIDLHFDPVLPRQNRGAFELPKGVKGGSGAPLLQVARLGKCEAFV